MFCCQNRGLWIGILCLFLSRKKLPPKNSRVKTTGVFLFLGKTSNWTFDKTWTRMFRRECSKLTYPLNCLDNGYLYWISCFCYSYGTVCKWQSNKAIVYGNEIKCLSCYTEVESINLTDVKWWNQSIKTIRGLFWLFIARNRACFDEEEFIYVTECP